MAQHFFAGEGNSDKANLDVNFNELYDLRAFWKTPSYTPTSPKFFTDTNGSLGIGAAVNAAWSLAAFAVRSAKVWSTGTVSYWIHNAVNNGTNWIYDATGAASLFQQLADGSFQWSQAGSGTAGGTISFSQVMNTDTSGNFWVGGGTTNPGVQLRPIGAAVLGNNAGSSGFQFLTFNRSGSSIGSVAQNGTTGVLYNTTSDYRLKSNPQPITDSGAFVDALKPVTFQWSQDGTTDQGFLAHEFQTVCPRAVCGVKDAVDGQGNAIFQAMDASTPAVIANLVAEIQSLRQRVAALGG